LFQSLELDCSRRIEDQRALRNSVTVRLDNKQLFVWSWG
jgi:hypothetical protein